MKLRPAILEFFTLPPPVRFAALILATVALGLMAGCAGFNVQGVVTLTYNTGAVTQAIMTPGVKEVQAPKAAASAPKGTGI